MGRNETLDFLSYTYLTNDKDDAHHISLKPYYPKVTTKRQNATLVNARDDEGFNAREENAFDLESGEEIDR